MQVKEPTFSVSNMFTFNSQQYFKYFDSILFCLKVSLIYTQEMEIPRAEM